MNPSAGDSKTAVHISRLLPPLFVLCLEAVCLTPLVEFHDDSMSWVAHPLAFTGSLVAATIFGLLAADRRLPRLKPWRSRTTVAVFWWGMHGVLFLLFLDTSLALHQPDRANTGGPTAALWAVLAAGVVVTAFLGCISARELCVVLWSTRRSALLAVGIAGMTVAAIPAVRSVWPVVAAPVVAITQQLTDWSTGDAVTTASTAPFPRVGSEGLTLLVTPQCSELESLWVFGVLTAVVGVRDRKRLREKRFVVVVLFGLALLYLLNGVRLWLLVLLGLRYSAEVCVNVAHSRIGTTVFLGISLAVILGTRRWWCAPAEANVHE